MKNDWHGMISYTESNVELNSARITIHDNSRKIAIIRSMRHIVPRMALVEVIRIVEGETAIPIELAKEFVRSIDYNFGSGLISFDTFSEWPKTVFMSRFG